MLFRSHKSWLGQLLGWQKTILTSLLFVWMCTPACLPTKAKVPPSPEFIQTVKRFEEAERLFQEQAYSEALAIYRDHLRRFPRGPLVDTALMKTGSVFMALEDYPQARKIFSRLVHEYPKSPFVEAVSYTHLTLPTN